MNAATRAACRMWWRVPAPGRLAFVCVLLSATGAGRRALAFEDTRVLPRGVTRVEMRVVESAFDAKTNGQGAPEGLGRPLERDLTFRDVIRVEKDALKRSQARAFMDYAGFRETDAVGRFQGAVTGAVTALAPVVAFGLTDAVTLAVAVPVMDLRLALGGLSFHTSDTGNAFVGALADPLNLQQGASLEARDRLVHATDQLRAKLADNGYRPLADYRERGLGDAQLLAKVRLKGEGTLRAAATFGVTAPTGRTLDPDVLLGQGLGDGQWDASLEPAVDEFLYDAHGLELVLGQYARYTAQLPGRRTMRLATSDEPIEVPKARVSYKLGDFVDAGTSLTLRARSGFECGAGYNYFWKDKDRYQAPATSARALAAGTSERAHQAEIEVGYSGVQPFLRGALPFPFDAHVNYKRQLASANMPVMHLLQFQTSIFF